MANQITDNRTVVCVAQTSAPASETWVATSSGTEDTEIFIEGTTSIAENMTNSLRYLMYDDGAARDWSNNVFYIWVNCGIVGLLNSKAAGGFRVRFAGNTVTDFFEVYVGGNDSWPVAVSGGWAMFVVDIEDAHTNSDNTGGTKPATNAIRHVGIAAITSIMPRNADNTWVDAIWRLPDGSPGIIVEGRNGGVTDWNSADIASQLGVSAGMFIDISVGGAYKVNAPIQFGINDTTVHGFSDTNAIWLWEDQEFVPADLYGLSALGNSGGTTRVNFGVKTGTGDDATGAQGLTISAASAGARWFMDFDDPDLDDIGFWGCSFQHGATFDWDDPAVDVASSLLVDCTKCHVSNANIVRAQSIAPNTADGVAFMDTDDLGDIVFSTFEFSDGHGIEVLSGGPASQTNKGNIFLGAYGGTPGDNLTPSSGSNDAMIYNNSAADKTFNRSDGGTQPSFRNGASATSDDEATISLTFTPLIVGSEVRLFDNATGSEIGSGVESSGTSYAASVTSGQAIDYKIVKPGYLEIYIQNLTFTASQNVAVNQQVDRNYDPVD